MSAELTIEVEDDLDAVAAVAHLARGHPLLPADRVGRESALLLVDRAAAALLEPHP